MKHPPQAPNPHAQPGVMSIADLIQIYTHFRQLPEPSPALKEIIANLETEILRFTCSFQPQPANHEELN